LWGAWAPQSPSLQSAENEKANSGSIFKENDNFSFMQVKRPEIPSAIRLEPVSASHLILRILSISVFLSAVVLVECRSAKPRETPTITFTKVPPAAKGGRERMDTVSGRVSGALPGQRVVIYAQSGPWWLQPWPEHPFIPIQSDSTWSTETHLGYEYAALLVNTDYHPAPTIDVAPAVGGSVAALKIVNGSGSLPDLPVVPLQFSGYDWKVRTVSAARGGLNNLYDPDNAWTDANGALHLRIRNQPAGWTCAQVVLARSLGYGTYNFVIRDTARLDPAVLLSLHTYDESAGDQHFREWDIEIGRWGQAASRENAQVGIQPFYVPGNLVRFTEPPGTLTYSVLWEPGRAVFKTFRGNSMPSSARPFYEHTFTAGIPSPGQELVEVMFYIVAGKDSPRQKNTEVVIDRFEYLP
jgi:hypothetical protein